MNFMTEVVARSECNSMCQSLHFTSLVTDMPNSCNVVFIFKISLSSYNPNSRLLALKTKGSCIQCNVLMSFQRSEAEYRSI
jgi:hypothetical protein